MDNAELRTEREASTPEPLASNSAEPPGRAGQPAVPHQPQGAEHEARFLVRGRVPPGSPRRREPANKRTCAHCVHAGWMKTRWPPQLLCVNSPGAPGKIMEVAPCSTCRNFAARREPPVRLPVPKSPNDKIRYIALTKGKFAIVDAEDYDRLMRHKWTAVCFGGRFYAQRNGGGYSIMMHREIMHAPKGMVVDHINGNGLDNRKCNLRICTQSQNILNSRPRGGSSRFKGVYYDKTRNKYVAFVWENRRPVHIGRYEDEIEAARARDYRAVEIGGLYVWLNFPEEWPKERIRAVYKKAQAARRRALARTQSPRADKRKTKPSTTKVTKTTKKT